MQLPRYLFYVCAITSRRLGSIILLASLLEFHMLANDSFGDYNLTIESSILHVREHRDWGDPIKSRADQYYYYNKIKRKRYKDIARDLNNVLTRHEKDVPQDDRINPRINARLISKHVSLARKAPPSLLSSKLRPKDDLIKLCMFAIHDYRPCIVIRHCLSTQSVLANYNLTYNGPNHKTDITLPFCDAFLHHSGEWLDNDDFLKVAKLYQLDKEYQRSIPQFDDTDSDLAHSIMREVIVNNALDDCDDCLCDAGRLAVHCMRSDRSPSYYDIRDLTDLLSIYDDPTSLIDSSRPLHVLVSQAYTRIAASSRRVGQTFISCLTAGKDNLSFVFYRDNGQFDPATGWDGSGYRLRYPVSLVKVAQCDKQQALAALTSVGIKVFDSSTVGSAERCFALAKPPLQEWYPPQSGGRFGVLARGCEPGTVELSPPTRLSPEDTELAYKLLDRASKDRGALDELTSFLRSPVASANLPFDLPALWLLRISSDTVGPCLQPASCKLAIRIIQEWAYKRPRARIDNPNASIIQRFRQFITRDDPLISEPVWRRIDAIRMVSCFLALTPTDMRPLRNGSLCEELVLEGFLNTWLTIRHLLVSCDLAICPGPLPYLNALGGNWLASSSSSYLAHLHVFPRLINAIGDALTIAANLDARPVRTDLVPVEARAKIFGALFFTSGHPWLGFSRGPGSGFCWGDQLTRFMAQHADSTAMGRLFLGEAFWASFGKATTHIHRCATFDEFRLWCHDTLTGPWPPPAISLSEPV